MRPVIKRAHQPQGRRHHPAPVDQRICRWPVGGEVASSGPTRLRTAAQPASELLEQVGQAVDRGGEAQRVEAMRGRLRRNVEPALHENVARIDLGRHQMPCHGMPARPVEQRPDRRVAPRPVGQRSVVEVDCPAREPPQQVGGQQVEIARADEPVDPTGQVGQPFRQLFGFEQRDALFGGKRAQRGKAGDDQRQPQPRLLRHACRLERQRGVADQGERHAHAVWPLGRRAGRDGRYWRSSKRAISRRKRGGSPGARRMTRQRSRCSPPAPMCSAVAVTAPSAP